MPWQGRAHFFGVAARAMRCVLVDHARRRGAAKRASGQRVTLDEEIAVTDDHTLDVAAIDDALQRLAALDERQARIVELRFFGGLEIAQTAEVLGISPATVKRDWLLAKAWLYRELSGKEG
jgi:RNA polymerase sigma factor (TIGR02999 family)